MKNFVCIIAFLLFVTSAFAIGNDIFNKGKMCPITAFRTIEGDSVTSNDLEGKVVVYNIGSESCAPCHAKIRGLNELCAQYQGNPNVKIVYVSLDNIEKAKKYKKRCSIQYDFTTLENTSIELDGKMSLSIPIIIVVNKKGKIVYNKVGGSTNRYDAQKDILDKIVPVIGKELKN